MLLAAGFERLSERVEWALRPGGRYFFTRNYSTIVAFAVGAKAGPGAGFHMVGAHTDSPCLKLKPVSKATGGGCLQLDVETYGGGLWHTWCVWGAAVGFCVGCGVLGGCQRRGLHIQNTKNKKTKKQQSKTGLTATSASPAACCSTCSTSPTSSA